MPGFIFKNRSRADWVAEYSQSHQHPVNRLCHTIGIPLVTLSIVGFLLALIWSALWLPSLVLFVLGWILQFTAMPLKASRRSSSRTGAFCWWD